MSSQPESGIGLPCRRNTCENYLLDHMDVSYLPSTSTTSLRVCSHICWKEVDTEQTILPKVSQVIANGDTRPLGTNLPCRIRTSAALCHGIPSPHKAHEAQHGGCANFWEQYPTGVTRARPRDFEFWVNGILTANAYEHLLLHRVDLGIFTSFIHIFKVFSTLISHV